MIHLRPDDLEGEGVLAMLDLARTQYRSLHRRTARRTALAAVAAARELAERDPEGMLILVRALRAAAELLPPAVGLPLALESLAIARAYGGAPLVRSLNTVARLLTRIGRRDEAAELLEESTAHKHS